MIKMAVLPAILVSLIGTPVMADWMGVSGAENARNIVEIHINDDHVRLDLEIFIEDMMIFSHLLPDEVFERTGIEKPPRDGSGVSGETGFQIISADGHMLRGTIKKIEPRLREERPSSNVGKINPITLLPYPGPPDDQRVLYVELLYPFDREPQSLTFVPPLEGGRAKAAIGFVAYHQQVLIVDFRFLPPSSTVTLDWEDPWYSRFQESSLQRWQRGSVMSFLYVEPFEVRHEILGRVRDIGAWIDLGLRGDEFIEADENELLKNRIGEFLMQQENLAIDGKQLRPILDRTAFVKFSMTGSTFLVEPERLSINNAMVGVIITYLVDEIPNQVTYEWNLWSDRIQSIPANAIDPAGGFPSFIVPDENVVTWTNYLKTYVAPTVVGVALDDTLTTWKVPLASALCVLALFAVA